MKRTMLVIGTLVALLLPTAAYADYNPLANACGNTAGAGGSSACTSNGSDPVTGSNGVLRKASLIIATLAGVAAVVMIIIGGFRHVTSDGDSSKAASARSTIIGALIGLVIIAAAETIVVFVINKIAKS